MSKAGSIVIDLLARTGSFITDLKRAESSLKKFAKSAKGISLSVSAATTALAVMVKNNISAIDELANKAAMIGTTTEKLSGLRYAAEQMAAVGAGTFDNALRRMTRRIHEATQGAGPAAKALEQLGLSAAELDRLHPDEQFKRLADAIKATQDQGQRLAVTMKLFDTEGMPLVNMLREGSTAIEDMEQQAAQLGLTLDGQTAAAAQHFGAELGKLSSIKQGFINQLTVQLLPSLVALTGHFQGTSEGAQRLGDLSRVAATGLKLAASVGVYAAQAFKAAAQYAGALGAAIEAVFSGEFQQARAIMKMAATDFKEVGSNTGLLLHDIFQEVEIDPAGLPQKMVAPVEMGLQEISRAGTRAVKQTLSETERLYQQIEGTLARLKVDIDGFHLGENERKVFELQVAGATPEQLERYGALLNELSALNEQREKTAQIEAEQAQAQGVLDRLNEEIATLGMSREELEKRNALLQAGVTAESEMGQAILGTVDALQHQREAMNQQIALMDEFRNSARDAFADVLSGTASAKDALTGFLDTVRQRLVNMAADQLMERALGALGGLGGGASGSWMSGLGGLFGGARATGGDVLGQRSYLVGERGPELFIPRTTGHVLNTEQTRALAGAGSSVGRSVNQTIQVKIEGRPNRRTPEQIARHAGRETRRGLSRTG